LRHVPIDLRHDWPKALRENGFDVSEPTAWLAEGLLMYLPGDAQDRLFEQVTDLSAPGSRVAAETVGVHAADRRARMRERFQQLSAQFEMDEAIDVAELMYDDPARSDVASWLDAHGWSESAVTSAGEMRRLERFVSFGEADDDSFSSFVVGVRA
jgi:methyltransferase (TIGR00027 family)